MNNRLPASTPLCCPDVSLGRQQGNTSEKPGNTAGNTRATQAPEGQSLREIARQRLGNTRATQAEMPGQHKALKTPPCVATLSDDFRCVATWWQWSPEDVDVFKVWAQHHHEDAAVWIRQEAETVLRYVEQLRVANVGEFIGGKND